MSVRCLSRLVLRLLTKIFAFSPALRPLAKILCEDERVRPQFMDSAIADTGSPELPVDIWMDVLALLEIPDLVRAGSVCSSWPAAYTNLRRLGLYRRPQMPCLLYTSESDGDDVACLYSLAEKRVYKLTLPEPPIRNRYIIGSSNGWLITADERFELNITNPITGEQIVVPSVTTIEHVEPIFDDAGVIQNYQVGQYYGEEVFDEPIICSRFRVYKAFVFPDCSNGNYMVVLIHNPIRQLSFAQEGDSEWTWLPPNADYEDCIYMDGLMYAVTSIGEIDAFDLTASTILRKVVMERTKDYIYGRLYLVQTPSGDLLQVWGDRKVALGDDNGEDARKRDPSEIIIETNSIKLHKVDMAAKEFVEIKGLHDHVLFLGLSQSQCVSAKEYPQLKGNHVYFTDDDEAMSLLKSDRRDIGVFNLEDNITEEIVPPQLWCNWPPPIWIAPNLTKLSLGFAK